MRAAGFSGLQRRGSYARLKVTERFFDGMLRLYDRTLQSQMRHRVATMIVSLVALALTVQLFPHDSEGISSRRGSRIYFVFTGVLKESVRQHGSSPASLGGCYRGPAVGGLIQRTAGRGSSRLLKRAMEGIFIHLVSIDKRKPGQKLFRKRPKLATIPGINAYPQIRQRSVFHTTYKSQYQFTLSSCKANVRICTQA
jgi:HAE1 family hydrophobic/amphiphilic exporter-1